jgi:hypothetical protein
MMDYLGWCYGILSAVDAAEKAGLAQPYVGVPTETISTTLFGGLSEGPAWHLAPQRRGLLDTLEELHEFGLLKSFGQRLPRFALAAPGRPRPCARRVAIHAATVPDPAAHGTCARSDAHNFCHSALAARISPDAVFT